MSEAEMTTMAIAPGTVDPNALGGTITVYNALDSTNGTTQALAANQGRILNERLTALEENTITITTATDADIDALFM